MWIRAALLSSQQTYLALHCRELSHELLHSVERFFEMFVPQFLTTTASQGCRGPTRILDLPPIHIALRQLLDELLGHRTLRNSGLLDECVPYLHLRRDGELIEVQRNVDARQESLIKGCDAVRG